MKNAFIGSAVERREDLRFLRGRGQYVDDLNPDWLLYAVDSPSASGARGLVRGQFFDRAGRLVASTAQEGLIRRRRTINVP